MMLKIKEPKIESNSVIRLLRELIRIPSVNPAIEENRNEEAIANYIAAWFRKTGKFRVVEQTVTGSRFNVIAILHGKSTGPSLMLNGHMDTVGTANMTIQPFNPTIRGDKIFGRGACDMKGALAD